MSTQEKQIRPLDGFARASDADVVSRATLVQTNMTGNANFPAPPVDCKEDMAIFKSSGFEPASTTKTATQPLSEKIRKIGHGANSGQIVVWIRSIPKASSYEIRYGVVGGGGRFSNCGNEAAIRYRDSPIRRMCSSSIH